MHVSDKFMKSILNESLKTSCKDNLDIVTTHVHCFLPENSIEFITYISRLKEPFELLELNDYCIVPYPSYIESKINSDVLADMGLLPKPKYLYGKVVGDSSYRDYNPYSASLKVNVLIHDDQNKMIHQEELVKHIEIQKINKLEIPYFKLYGKDKQ